jgi:hypothetical protein
MARIARQVARHWGLSAETTYISGWSFGRKWSISGRLIAVQDLLHIVDVHGWPPASRFQVGEDLRGDCLLALLVATGITKFDHGGVHAAERHV